MHQVCSLCVWCADINDGHPLNSVRSKNIKLPPEELKALYFGNDMYYTRDRKEMYTKLFPANVKREGTLAEHIIRMKNVKTMTGFMWFRMW